jgi:glucokinase
MGALYLGLDLGGTKTAVGIVADDGSVLAQLRVTTAELRKGGDPLSALVRLARRVMAEIGIEALAGVGIALPGPVDPAGDRMLAAPTIPELLGVSVGGRLEAEFGCPARGENDANACALAEARFGAGRGLGHLVYVTISTGIGGGAVAGGRLTSGAHGTATEFGHQVILPEGGPACDCGGNGCLESLASGRGIERQARSAGLGSLTAEAVAAAARAGDEKAVAVYRQTALYLGIGISNVINILDPNVVVLGGGVGLGAADLLLQPVREVVAQRCMPSLRRGTPVVTAGLGTDLGVVSAACLAMPARP